MRNESFSSEVRYAPVRCLVTWSNHNNWSGYFSDTETYALESSAIPENALGSSEGFSCINQQHEFQQRCTSPQPSRRTSSNGAEQSHMENNRQVHPPIAPNKVLQHIYQKQISPGKNKQRQLLRRQFHWKQERKSTYSQHKLKAANSRMKPETPRISSKQLNIHCRRHQTTAKERKFPMKTSVWVCGTSKQVIFDALLYASNGCMKHVLFAEERKKRKRRGTKKLKWNVA
jgi:hypothetical protein